MATKKPTKKTAKKTPVAKKNVPAKKAAAVKKKAGVKKKGQVKSAPAKKSVPAKKATPAKKLPAKKAAPKKKAATNKALKPKLTVKKAPAKKEASVAKKATAKKKPAAKTAVPMNVQDALANGTLAPVKPPKTPYKAAFLRKQEQKLKNLRDDLMDAMAGVTRDTLRSDTGGNDASGFGMHQADAGSDAYDRDFALNLLAQEQDALHEIDAGLERIKQGYYGICEMTGKQIGQARLEAMPFCRYTVEYQAYLEKDRALNGQRSKRPLEPTFGQDLAAELKSSLE